MTHYLGWYRLDDAGNPIPEPDARAWGEWRDSQIPGPLDAHKTYLATQEGPVEVSTVFLGLDHSHGIGTVPILWETMIFTDGDMSGDKCWRYATRTEAHRHHAALVEALSAGLPLPEPEEG
ncbi:MAG TPA: hypothetical protein VHA75_09140 [Rugosimonospora sp.]|nr:hypothetical protein [Rugosimonospora sp.]